MIKNTRTRFSELFISKILDLRFLSALRADYPDSRSLYWDPAISGRRELELAISMAERVVVQDGLRLPLDLCSETSQDTEIEFETFSEFAPGLTGRFDRVLSKSNASEVSFDANGAFLVKRGPVLFCPSNDTHTKLFHPISRHLERSQFLYHDQRPQERAREMMESLEIAYLDGGAECLEEIAPSVIVVGNDWYDGAWQLFERAYALGIPTVCIQEGCLDFVTQRRMQYCDYAFIQGPLMLDHVANPALFISGNPRFDSISNPPAPAKPVVMLNCNFTYGVEEENREKWIGEIARSCRELELDYFISQHPRDRGHFPNDPVRPSHAGVVHDHVAASSILVTRFSTLVYEAMRAGRRVIYYNPHGEKMRLFNEDETGGIFKAHDPESLREALVSASAAWTPELESKHTAFMSWQCGENDGRAAFRSAGGLAAIANNASPRTGRNRRDWLTLCGHRRRTSLSRFYLAKRKRLRASLSPLKRMILGGRSESSQAPR
jgi:hypothetical protein